MTLTAGTLLGSYEILSPLGAGGMGEVYRARDRRLERDVAIKVLPGHLSAHPEALTRFEREAKVVAALSHPNILSIFDVGSQDGTSYAVMELLEGETLRSKLEGGALSQRQAVDYAQQMAKGLAAAHERGVVHRDLKPENVFVSKDGHLKILDFGLAKREEPVPAGKETSAPTASGHTEPGTVMGTVGYMSPEQVRGQAVDHRSDIFAFGAILYEMLWGKRAFQRHTAADTMSAILKEDPPELTTSGHAILPLLDHTIKHCLEKDRDHRFQSARDIQFALAESTGPAAPISTGLRVRALILVAAALLVGAAGAIWLARRSPGPTSAPTVKRIVVLPFENLGSPDDDYFADGMADEIRGKLTMLSGVEVIARSSSVLYKGSKKTPQDIGRELNTRYLLMATIRWDKATLPGRVRVRPELVEITAAGVPKAAWQQPFDAAMTDVFQVQADIASRVAGSLGVALDSGQQRRLEKTPTSNLAAYDIFLRAEEMWMNWGAGPLTPERALSLYEQAVALDPGFAEAWARVSQASSSLFDMYPTAEIEKRARDAANRALALAPDIAQTHLALSNYEYLVRYDTERALGEAEAARRIAPGDAAILTNAARMELVRGSNERALDLLWQAKSLDPRSADISSQLGGLLINLRRYREARQVFDHALALWPIDLRLIQGKAFTYLGEGNLTGARSLLDHLPAGVDETLLVVHFAVYSDLAWVLNEGQLDLLLRLTPSAFTNQEEWAFCLAQGFALRRNDAAVKAHAETARHSLETRLKEQPKHAQGHGLLGIALALLGQRERAIDEGALAVSLAPAKVDYLSNAYYRLLLAKTYTLVGEEEKAITELEALLAVPFYISRAWLRIDPNFDTLRGNGRFQRLVHADES